MNLQDVAIIQTRIGYEFKNKDLLQQAFVRRSYSKENGGENNEVLEFIGDRVLDFIIVKLLAEEFGSFCSDYDEFDRKEDFDEFISDLNEAELTELKKEIVKKNTLANTIDDLELADYLIMGKSDINNNVQNSPSVKEDLFEAIIGAIALDSNWNMGLIQDAVEFMLKPEEFFDSDEINYVSEIQEWSLKNHGQLPRHFMKEENRLGFYSLYNPYTMPSRSANVWSTVLWEHPTSDFNFTCELFLKGMPHGFGGRGLSKSEARREACRLAYEYLAKENLLFTIQDEIDDPSHEKAISQLEILSRRGYFSIPEYAFEETFDDNGNPVWRCECRIKERGSYCRADSSSKKSAKKDAAYEMLKDVLMLKD